MESKKEAYKNSTFFFGFSYLPIIWLIYGININSIIYVTLQVFFVALLVYVLYPSFLKINELREVLIALQKKQRKYIIVIIYILLMFINILAWVSNILNFIENNYNPTIISFNFLYLILHLLFLVQSSKSMIESNEVD